MIIRGHSKGAISGTAGLGLSSIEPRRQDLAPSGPGYVDVTFGSGDDPPPPPYFSSVVAENGQITIVLGCTQVVDSFELAVTTLPYPPSDGSNILASASGNFVIPGTDGSQYLHARSVRGGARSSWFTYGQAVDPLPEWVTVLEESPIAGSVDGAAYHDLLELTGGEVRWHNYWSETELWPNTGAYDAEDTIALFTGAGVRMTEFGCQISTRLRISNTTNVDCRAGVVFMARDEARTSWETESFYVLFYLRVSPGDMTDQRIVLGKFVNGVYSEIARSANLYPAHFGSSALQWKYITFYVRSNTFTVAVEGEEVWEYTNTDIAAAADRVYCGLYWYSYYYQDTHYLTTLMRVAYRNQPDEAYLVDPGIPGDSLKEDVLAAHFPLSHYARVASYNDSKDCCHLRLDDSDQLEVQVYSEDGTRQAGKDVVIGAKIHNLIDTTNHPVTGLTTGHPLRATGATTYGFGTIAQAHSHDSPDTDAATTSLHHQIGTGATQAAAGNHAHTGVYCAWRGALASDPATNVQDGDMYFNTGDNKIYVRANSAWNALN